MKTLDMIKREIQGVKFERQFSFNDAIKIKSRGVIDETNMVVEMIISSEEPCLREYGYEILSHDPSAVNMSRILNNAPLLQDHKSDDVNGIIESARLLERNLFLIARFSDNPKPKLIFNDVNKKIRKNVSVGYTIEEIIQADYEIDGKRVFIATKWTPVEGSIVGIAFDHKGSGIGRSLEAKSQSQPDENKPAHQGEGQESTKIFAEVNKMDPVTKEELDKLRNSTNEREKRAAEIIKIGQEFKMEKEALAFLTTDKPVQEFSNEILRSYEANKQEFVRKQTGSTEMMIAPKDLAKYNLFSAIEGADQNKGVFQKSLELDLSQEYAKHCGRQPTKGIFIPPQYQAMAKMSKMAKRSSGLTAASNASAGYSTSAIMHPEMYIDSLNNATRVGEAGATVLRDLKGNSIVIPRKIARGTGEWVAEDNSADRSAFTLDQVTLSPKTFSSWTSCSRLLRLESSLDIMNLIQNDLMQEVDIKIDYAAINGSGSNSEPTGIRYQTGINSVTTATDGSALTHALVLSARKAIYKDNVKGKLSWLLNADTEGSALSVPRVSAQAIFLINNGLFEDMPYFLTEQCVSNLTKGSGTSLSSAICGYFPDLLLGYWGGLELIVNPYTMGPTGETEVSVLQSADVAVRHAESFCEFRDIITA